MPLSLDGTIWLSSDDMECQKEEWQSVREGVCVGDMLWIFVCIRFKREELEEEEEEEEDVSARVLSESKDGEEMMAPGCM